MGNVGMRCLAFAWGCSSNLQKQQQLMSCSNIRRSHTALPCCLSAGGLTLCGGTRCALVTFSLPLPQSFEPQNTQRTKYPVEPTSRYSHAGQITASDDVSCVCVQRCLMTNSAQDPGKPKRGSPGVVQRLLSSQSLRGIQGQQPLQQQHPLL